MNIALLIIYIIFVGMFFWCDYNKNKLIKSLMKISSDSITSAGEYAHQLSEMTRMHENKDALAIDAINVLDRIMNSLKNDTYRPEYFIESYQEAKDFLKSIPTRAATDHFKRKNLIIQQLALDGKVNPDVIEEARRIVAEGCCA